MPEKRRYMNEREINTILHECGWGVFSFIDENNKPYAVPLNYVFDETTDALYCHMALRGHKMRAILSHPEVHVTIVAEEKLVPNAFVTHYKSVMLEGTAHIIEEPARKRAMIEALCQRLAPEEESRFAEVIDKYWPALAMMWVQINHRSGKVNEDD